MRYRKPSGSALVLVSLISYLLESVDELLIFIVLGGLIVGRVRLDEMVGGAVSSRSDFRGLLYALL